MPFGEIQQQPVTDEEFEEIPEKISDQFNRVQKLLEAELNSNADTGE